MLHTTATERDQASCLPPEAYLRIMNSCVPAEEPKFLSSVFPTKKEETKRLPKKTQIKDTPSTFW